MVDILNNIFIDSIGLPLLRTSETSKRLQLKSADSNSKFSKNNEDLKKVEAVRAGKRKREISLLQEALDTLDGYAGQWLADNEVQQIEGQLALTKTTLDEVQKTATKEKKDMGSL